MEQPPYSLDLKTFQPFLWWVSMAQVWSENFNPNTYVGMITTNTTEVVWNLRFEEYLYFLSKTGVLCRHQGAKPWTKSTECHWTPSWPIICLHLGMTLKTITLNNKPTKTHPMNQQKILHTSACLETSKRVNDPSLHRGFKVMQNLRSWRM